MVINTIVDTHPARIRTLKEVDDILSMLEHYEAIYDCKAGVVLKQNRQLGGSYRIVSKDEAERGINNPNTCEWYVRFFSHSYFEELKRKLSE